MDDDFVQIFDTSGITPDDLDYCDVEYVGGCMDGAWQRFNHRFLPDRIRHERDKQSNECYQLVATEYWYQYRLVA